MYRTIRVVLLLTCGLASLASLPAQAQLIGDMADVMVPLAEPRVEQAGKRAAYTFGVARVASPFNGVVVQGTTSSESLEGWVRFEDRAGWSDWQALYLVRSATDGSFLGAYRGTVYRQDQRLELRFDLEGPSDLHLVGAGVFDNRNDTDRHAEDTDTTVLHKGEEDNFVITPLTLNTRAAWGAAAFIGTPIPLNRPSYTNITFHHAAGFPARTRAEGLQQVKAIQEFHQNGRGWSDIGYQFVMDMEGRLYQGRPFMSDNVAFGDGPPLAQGAHVGGNNTGNIGVSVLGCYHPPEGSNCQDEMTPAALDSLLTMFSYLVERYGVTTPNIKGHRDFSSTACPGDNNYRMLPAIRTSVEDLLRTGNRPLGTASMDATADEDGVVQLSWAFIDPGAIAGYRIERVEEPEMVTVLFEGEGALPETIVDAQVERPGTVSYRLSARDATGRTQILASAQTTIETPDAFVLTHNFPNPFTTTTTIRYFLKRDGIVSLKVFDGMGRAVATLEDTYRERDQWYTATLDGAGLAGGVYYYRIQVEGFAGIDFDKTRTIVLVK